MTPLVRLPAGTCTIGRRWRWQRKLMGRKNQRIAAKRNTEMAKSETGEATTPYEPRKLG